MTEAVLTEAQSAEAKSAQNELEQTQAESTADQRLVLSLGSDGRVHAKIGDSDEQPISIHRCFPWLEPHTFLSLRNEKDEEIALVEQVSDLGEASQKVLRQAMDLVGFTMEITSIKEIRKFVELRNWTVLTRQGERIFQTLLDEWPEELPDGSLLIKDVAGDLYRIPVPSKLDAHSRKQIWALTL